MKIAIVGAGAIGGYLGAKLSLAGDDVTFIARNRNLAAIAANGFRLELPDGTTQHAPGVRAVQDPADAGPQDAVLLTTKAHQVRDLLPGLRAMFGPETMVVTMINGVPWWYFQRLGGPYDGRTLTSVDPDGALAAGIEVERIIGSIVYPAAELVEPGVVRVVEGNRFSARRARRPAHAAHRGARALVDGRRLQGAGVARHPQRAVGQAVGQPQLQPDQRAHRTRRSRTSAASRRAATSRRG